LWYGIHVLYELDLNLDCDCGYAYLGLFTESFKRKCKLLLKCVTQIANMNSFVQERVTGMKIVQLFNREKIEYEKFKTNQQQTQNCLD
jgi:ABC-type multidrug transport system fused ATPase/permease subunit